MLSTGISEQNGRMARCLPGPFQNPVPPRMRPPVSTGPPRPAQSNGESHQKGPLGTHGGWSDHAYVIAHHQLKTSILTCH